MSIEPNSVDPSFWAGKRVLLTGHTGFKGGWASVWLKSMGAELAGLSLAPTTEDNLFECARVGDNMHSAIGDIRSFETVDRCVQDFKPEIVLHMAAQPLVRYSYRNPVETYATNVMGTVHVLEAARRAGSVKVVVNVTTDKCYENNEWPWGYRETEPMGGKDPYSSSKGCSELVTAAFRDSFMNAEGIALASARAGNVIGGGDWSEDRLIPDILHAFAQSQAVVIRNPLAQRPWQHVLEPVGGYLQLAQKLYQEGDAWAQGWNFGPVDEDARPVQWIVEKMADLWGQGASWHHDESVQLHEAHFLKLDISKAKAQLKWQPRWRLQAALQHTVAWYRAWQAGRDMQTICLEQIKHYQESNNE